MLADENISQNAQASWPSPAVSPPRCAVPLAVGSILILVDPQEAEALLEQDIEHFGPMRAEPAPTPARTMDLVAQPRIAPQDAGMLGWLEEAARERGIVDLVEFGCDRGGALHDAMRRGVFATAAGVDPNAGLIEAAQRHVIDPRIHFACGDAVDWALEFGRPGTAYLAAGGQLARVPHARVKLLLGQIALRLRPAVIGLVEPIAADADLESDRESRPGDRPHTFSHPYRRLLHETGFTVLRQRDATVDGRRWLWIVAEAM